MAVSRLLTRSLYNASALIQSLSLDDANGITLSHHELPPTASLKHLQPLKTATTHLQVL
jgi:hypothetical protein